MFESGCSLCPLSVHFKDAWWQCPLSLHKQISCRKSIQSFTQIFLYLTSVGREKKSFLPCKKNLDDF